MNKRIGSSLDELLEQEDILHEVEAYAIKKYFSAKIQNKMLEESISKSKLALTMNTSRAAIDRLLDPQNNSITLKTMEAAAKALGKRLRIELV